MIAYNSPIGSTTVSGNWSNPLLIETREIGETIEMIFSTTSNMIYTAYPPREPEKRIFKIVFSCIDGKWNKSDRIYGKIIPARDQHYEFDNI